MGAVLSLRAVRHRRAGREVLRLDALDLSAGERLAVLGPNGAGKTTLLRLLAAIEAPSDGTVRIDGVSTTTGGVALRRRVAYATQRPGLLHATVLGNVELPLRWRGVSRRRRRVLATAALERLGIAHLAARPAHSLSGGEMQRVSLARALATEPSLLLLDEPAASLDPESRASFFADVDDALAERSATVVHVSHRAEEAMRLSDRVAVLVSGELRQLDTPTALAGHPRDATVARLVGYENVVEATTAGPIGPAAIAVWAAGVRLDAGTDAGTDSGTDSCAVGEKLHTVIRVTPGPGCWEISLDGPDRLRAHLPRQIAPPHPGQRVSVTFDPDFVAMLHAE